MIQCVYNTNPNPLVPFFLTVGKILQRVSIKSLTLRSSCVIRKHRVYSATKAAEWDKRDGIETMLFKSIKDGIIHPLAIHLSYYMTKHY